MTFPKKASVKKIFFYLVLIFIPLFAIEVLVRAYFATQVGPRVLLYGTMFSRHQEKFDPKGVAQRWESKERSVSYHENVRGAYSKYYPHQTLVDRDEFGKRINVTINSRGFRGKDYEPKKQRNVIRIITLGASSTFGFHDHEDQTYPHYMEQMLNEALPRLNAQRHSSSYEPIKAFEVINLGVPHLTSEQIYALLVNEGLELDPDFVTFYEGINDTVWGSPDTPTETMKHSIKAVPFANQIFREMRYRLLSIALIGMLITQSRDQFSDSDIQALRREKREHFIANLQRIYEACMQKESKLIVAGQQATTLEAQREKLQGMTYEDEQALVQKKLLTKHRLPALDTSFLLHKELMDAERQWAMTNDVQYADVIGAMDLNRQYLVTWVHLNAAGNRIVAAVLSSEILKQIAGKEFPVTQKP
jgi:GDSL-like Lipase/Acylhydrolase family